MDPIGAPARLCSVPESRRRVLCAWWLCAFWVLCVCVCVRGCVCVCV